VQQREVAKRDNIHTNDHSNIVAEIAYSDLNVLF
jgi:hypothetical protein